MKNTKDEFIGHIKNREVLCCEIRVTSAKPRVEVFLTTGWTKEEWILFIRNLDVEYDNGYGSQELYGTIWYKDGTWSDREEYDGSESWRYNKCPEISPELNRVDKLRDEKLNTIIS